MTQDDIKRDRADFEKLVQKDRRKSQWQCAVKIVVPLLIEIMLIVAGILLNNFTILQYTPMVLYVGAGVLVPFAYKASKDALDCLELHESLLFSMEIMAYSYFEMELRRIKEVEENDTNQPILTESSR